MSREGLISVRTALVQEVLVERIAARVAEREGEPLPAGGLLTSRFDPGADDAELGARLARAGYLMRLVEAELFEPARLPAPLEDELRELRDEVGDRDEAITHLARELATSEPLGKPAPDDGRAASWAVPGPGGHVRHLAARRLVAERAAGAAGDELLKRDVMFGFFLRCCEEALPPPRHAHD